MLKSSILLLCLLVTLVTTSSVSLSKSIEGANDLIYSYLTKTHNWVEWTAPSVSLLQTKVNDINLNDRPQMQNDTENEIGRSLFPFIHGLRILISFDYLYINHIDT